MSHSVLNPLTNVFDAEQHDQLAKIQRFLTNVADPQIVRRVALYGYDAQEHGMGWQLYAKATGMSRPLDFFVSAKEQIDLPVNDRTKTLLREIDQFENKWFPRVETMLDRCIDATQNPSFIAAFFQDLAQQTEGSLVIDSVTKLVDRVEALAASEVPGAKEAFDGLVKRGLTAEVRADIRAKLDSALQLRPALPVTVASAVDLAQTALEQQAAYQKLVSWYRDWATTFRQELGYHSLVRLGLRVSKPPKTP